jgi:hypothetical protein
MMGRTSQGRNECKKVTDNLESETRQSSISRNIDFYNESASGNV